MVVDSDDINRFSPLFLKLMDKSITLYFDRKEQEARKDHIRNVKEIYDKKVDGEVQDERKPTDKEIEKKANEVMDVDRAPVVRDKDSDVEKFRKYLLRFNQTSNPKELERAMNYADVIECASCADLLGKAYENAQDGNIDTAKTQIVGVITYLSMYEEGKL